MEDFLTSATLWSRFVTGYLEEGAATDKEGTDGGDEKEVREQDESGEIKIKRNGIEGTTSKIVAKVEKRKKGRKKNIYIYVGEKKKKKYFDRWNRQRDSNLIGAVFERGSVGIPRYATRIQLCTYTEIRGQFLWIDRPFRSIRPIIIITVIIIIVIIILLRH